MSNTALTVPPAPRLFSLILSVIGLCVLFLLLAAAYGRRFPLLATQFDIWFRTDVSHYMQWVKSPGFAYRFPLHPATLLLIKPYSFTVGRLLAVEARFLPLFSLPVVVFHSITLPLALYRLDAKRFPWLILLALIVGPLLILAPIPESHTLGGLSLLMTAVCVWRSRIRDAQDTAPWLRRALFWGIAATGFSVSNVVPAVLVAYPLWRGFRPSRKLIFLVVGLIALILLLGAGQLFIRYRQETAPGDFLPFVLARFERWLRFPDATAVLRSLRALIMAPFGVPDTAVFGYTSEAGVQYGGIILKDAPNLFQIAAAVAWIGGTFLTFRVSDTLQKERDILLGCLLALLWLILFHSFFAADEAYMFSVHAWPFLLLPGLLAFRANLVARSPVPLALLGTAFLLALLQTAIALPALFRLPI